jgi:hypothetical protein
VDSEIYSALSEQFSGQFALLAIRSKSFEIIGEKTFKSGNFEELLALAFAISPKLTGCEIAWITGCLIVFLLIQDTILTNLDTKGFKNISIRDKNLMYPKGIVL